MIIIELDSQQLSSLIKNAVCEAIESKNLQTSSADEDELLTVQDAAKFLRLAVPTIYGLISKRKLPVMKRSKRCYFSKIELLNYLKAGRKETSAELDAAADDYLNTKGNKSH